MRKPDPTKSEQTQGRILQAATAEFSNFGIAGARVDRIAQTAKANKSLIYSYFESKEKLFSSVLAKQLESVYDAVEFSAADLPGYAAALFDFAMDHPHLMRLVMWNGLQQRPEWPLDDAISLKTQVRQIAQAQSDGIIATEYPPEFLLTFILTLASAWTAANPFGISITPNAHLQRTSLRTALSNAVDRLCRPVKPSDAVDET